jgi:hypothetical protein
MIGYQTKRIIAIMKQIGPTAGFLITVMGCKTQSPSHTKDLDLSRSFECPEIIEFQFGAFSTQIPGTRRSVEAIKNLQDTTQNFIKTRGRRVCRYKAEGVRGELKLNNYSKKSLHYDVPIQQSDNVSFTHFLSVGDLQSGRVDFENAKFSHYFLFVDEDGCAFAQTTCEPMPAEYGTSAFSELRIKFMTNSGS